MWKAFIGTQFGSRIRWSTSRLAVWWSRAFWWSACSSPRLVGGTIEQRGTTTNGISCCNAGASCYCSPLCWPPTLWLLHYANSSNTHWWLTSIWSPTSVSLQPASFSLALNAISTFLQSSTNAPRSSSPSTRYKSKQKPSRKLSLPRLRKKFAKPFLRLRAA